MLLESINIITRLCEFRITRFREFMDKKGQANKSLDILYQRFRSFFNILYRVFKKKYYILKASSIDKNKKKSN